MALDATSSFLSCKELPMKKIKLYTPPLDDVAQVLQNELAKNFSEASVRTTDCPDLSLPPFNLTSPGLGGQCTLLDVGSSSYLTPLARRDKIYDIKDLAEKIVLDPAFIIGAGLGPWPHVGVNCEMIADVRIKGEEVYNQTRVAHIAEGKCKLERLPNFVTRCAILVNLFCSKGETNQVLKVNCQKRRGNDIITCMRKALNNHYEDKIIGLGGTFILRGSPAKQHIMPEFSTTPLKTPEAVQNWIKFYNHVPPLIVVGTLVSDDPGLDLKVQHFHGINSLGEGGHFYSDTDPQQAEYEGYFALGENLYKVDQP